MKAITIFLMAVLLLFSLATAETKTSENNQKLKRALKKYPQADSNGDGILTMNEANIYKKTLKKKKRGKQSGKKDIPYSVQPTHKDVKYGKYDRNILDFWKVDSDKPAPVLVYIHGGGLKAGSKEKAAKLGIIKKCLSMGIHFASINYRYAYRSVEDLSDPQRTGKPGCFFDGARAIQYIRYNAQEWNVDKKKVIAFGNSAGGGITLFLGLQDDIADPDSEDEVLRQSSRLFAMGHFASQPTSRTDKWPEILGMTKEQLSKVIKPNNKKLPWYVKLGLKSEEELSSELGKKYESMVDMISHASSDDPPIFIYIGAGDTTPKTRGHLVHHPRLSMYVDKICKENGMQSKLFLPRVQKLGQVDHIDEFLKWVNELIKN
jgi:acetyl esterase/lipase